jgi:hypothetical protein
VKGSGNEEQLPLMIIQLAKGEATNVQRRADQAGQALRAAWLLGLPDPESVNRTPP